ncbi:MAG: M20/M25/M40 family metallo-hydrolase [Oscillospiraceae bacterium]|nr:M20/M25/M40 family metallo-hydrolase [Oscillospiraceae bacterium]
MNRQFFYEMLSTDSVSGNEIKLQKKIIDYMADTVDAYETNATGGLVCILNPQSRQKVLLAGHIDEIGLMVTHVEQSGMLKVAKVGGIRVRQYLGQKVRVHTQNGIVYGAVVCTSELLNNKDLGPESLSIDIGASSGEEALRHVALGDTVTFDTDYRELLGGHISARAIDNRGGAFIVIEALRRAKERGCTVGVYAATTPGEETSMRGAYFAAQQVEPTMAIAVDVTYATDYPGTDKAETGDVRLGKGPVICNSTIINKKMNALLIEAANKAGIPYQIEAAVARTGTDIDKIHFTGKGVPTALVSLPLRYMHCPNEVAHLDDVEHCIELLAEFLLLVDENTDLDPFH